MDRREVLNVIAGAGVAAFASGQSGASNGMIYRKLGRTGERVSAIGIGGAHLGETDQKEAIRIVRSALDRGIMFLDNCWDYSDGDCEKRMGMALRDAIVRKRF